MSKISRQAQFRVPVKFAGTPGTPGAPGARGLAGATTVVVTPPTTPASLFDSAAFLRLLCGHGRVLVGNGHALWTDLPRSLRATPISATWRSGEAARGNYIGGGSPEGVVTANPGARYHDRVGHVDYVKITGIGNTGWL